MTRREAVLKGAALGLSLPVMIALGAGAGRRFAVAAQEASPTPKTGGTLKVGLSAGPAELDSHLTSLTAAWHMIERVYEGLVRVSATLEPEPSLAESWDISDDGLTYTFALRQGVTFHNGRAFVVDDVKYSLWRIVGSTPPTVNASELASIATIEAPDPATAVITLKAPDASFLVKLMGASIAIVPKEEVEKNTDLKLTMVGTGPFEFIEYILNTRVTLARNAEYWDTGKPYLDGLTMEIVPDSTTPRTALVSGTVDFIAYAPAQDLPLFEGDSSLVVTGGQNTNIRYMACNIQRKPFNKLKVRQAIAKVIDREPIIDSAVFGGGIPTLTIFPGTYWAGQDMEIPAPDIEGAKQLLATAGVPDDFQTTLHSWAAYPFLSNAAIVVQEQLRQIGIEAETDFQKNATYLANYFKGNFDLSVTGTNAYIDPNDVIQTNFGTDESNNGIKYSNPEVNKLIAEGVAVTD